MYTQHYLKEYKQSWVEPNEDTAAEEKAHWKCLDIYHRNIISTALENYLKFLVRHAEHL